MEVSTYAGTIPSKTEDTGLFVTRIVLVCFLYLPLAAITVLGNIFVLAAYRRDERIRKKKTNTFILNLAIADLLVGLVMLINTPKYIKDKWYFGREFCIFTWAIDYMSTDMSVITIIAISVDRYLMVRNTMKHQLIHQSRRRLALIFSVIWFLCIFVHISLAFSYSAKTDYKYLKYQTCNLEYRREKALVISMCLVEFVLPVVCLCLLNTKVFLHIQRRGSKIRFSQPRKVVASDVHLGKDKASGLYDTAEVRLKTYRVLSSPDGKPVELPGDIAECSSRSPPPTITVGDLQEKNPLKKDTCEMRIHHCSSSSRARPPHKAAKLLTALLIVFIISWLPYYIYECYILFDGGEASDAVTQTLTCILWANSAVNPILYACANVHYRNNFMHFLHLGKGMRVSYGRTLKV